MNEKFCPPYCNFKFSKSAMRDGCHCQNTKEYSKPIPIELRWFGTIWVKALIIGEVDDKYIVKAANSNGLDYIKKSSRAIRRNGKREK